MKISPAISPRPYARRRRPTDNKRKERIVMATDSEWQIIEERAETARMSISRFMVERALVRHQHAGGMRS